MEKMLEYIGRLGEIDTEGVEPLINIFDDNRNIFREDVVKNDNMKLDILANAPQKEKDMFVVPKTV